VVHVMFRGTCDVPGGTCITLKEADATFSHLIML